jgi:hypothetical protein
VVRALLAWFEFCGAIAPGWIAVLGLAAAAMGLQLVLRAGVVRGPSSIPAKQRLGAS